MTLTLKRKFHNEKFFIRLKKYQSNILNIYTYKCIYAIQVIFRVKMIVKRSELINKYF